MNDIAIIQLAAFGDVTISTVIPHAIKQKYPNSRITFYTSTACEGAVHNNQDIDQIIAIPANKAQAWSLMPGIIENARKKHQKIITPWPGHRPESEWRPLGEGNYNTNFMWSYYRAAQELGLEIPKPFQLYLWTTEAERNRAKSFLDMIKTHNPNGPTIMMEAEGHSGQNHFNSEWVTKIIEGLINHYNTNVRILISKGGVIPQEIKSAMDKWPWRIHMLNEYSLREASIMFNECIAFIGGSSGTSNACHGHQCKKNIKWFEAIVDMKWSSQPLAGPENKSYYLNSDPNEFVRLIRSQL